MSSPSAFYTPASPLKSQIQGGRTSKEWRVLPPAPQEYLAQLPELRPLLAQCLYNRGFTNSQEAYAFLSCRVEEDTPFRLQGMHKAVARIRQAIRQGEQIAIYGDFDADGVAATAILTQTISSLGGHALPYIPHRVDEGYGLHIGPLRALVRRGCTLLVTVDCGVRSFSEVEYAHRLGLEVIITDHHSVPPQLPPALAVINPKQQGCPYPFKHLSGAGVAFKLAQALLRVNRRVPLPKAAIPITEEELLDLVALGTVTDLAPLVGENRRLVKRGLESLRVSPRPGLAALLASIKPEAIDSHTLGYILGPRLNAAGRLGDAMVSYRLLTTSSPAEAQELAQELEGKNRRRQELTSEILERALEEIEGREREPLLLAKGEFPQGIIGLVASRLCEEFYRPAVLLSVGEDECRGSARSIPEFNITAALEECQELLIKFGGHSQAAGFTLEVERLPALEERLRLIAARQLEGLELAPTLLIDAQIPLSDLDPATIAALPKLEPFGPSNPLPTFLSQGVEVRESRLLGEAHLGLTLTDARIVWDAIAFGRGQEVGSLPDHLDLVYTPEVNWWGEQPRLRLRIHDLKPQVR